MWPPECVFSSRSCDLSMGVTAKAPSLNDLEVVRHPLLILYLNTPTQYNTN